MLREVAAAADPLTILTNFGAITDAIGEHTTTNIPLRFLPDLIGIAGNLDRTKIVTDSFQAGSRHAPDSNYRGLRIIDVQAARSTVQRVLADLGSATSGGPGGDECGD